MKPNPQYLAPVKGAVDALAQLSQMMFDDLDEDHHGFTWWRGYADDKRLALIAEYLIASVDGTTTSLADAAFVVDEFNGYSHADTKWTRDKVEAVREVGGDMDMILRALSRTGIDEKRERRLRLSREHVFYHLAQTFDRLAAVIIGVGALRVPILKADWQVVDDERKWKKSQGSEGGPWTQPVMGRDHQDRLRTSILKAVDSAGPTDWRRWIDGTRNTNAHRAPKIQMQAVTKPTKTDSERLVYLFERQPKWSMTEAIVGSQKLGLDSVWLIEEPLELMRGMLGATASVVEAVASLLAVMWVHRREGPQLLVQPAAQWPKVMEEPELKFPGFGNPVQLNEGAFRISPRMGRRMRASGVFNPELWK